jgi:hypothetical protein
MCFVPLLASLCILASPLKLQNGDFSHRTDGLADGWQQAGHYTLLARGGRNGAPAVELRSKPQQSNAALQVIKFDPPREDPFAISAWMRLDHIGEGGDCCVYLDVLQSVGEPIWGVRGEPDRWKVGEWQKVTARVNPTHPVREVQVYLILRDVEGKARFCNVVSEQAEADASDARRIGPDRFSWWVESSMTRVFQDDLPPERPVHKVRLDLARNERESFQICLRAGEKPAGDVRVGLSALKSGGKQLPQITWNRVGYVWVEKPADHPLSPRRGASWWPDPLLPARSFGICPGEVQPLWFTVHAPRDASPGTYTGKITISEGPGVINVPVEVVVHRATLPVKGHIKTAFALMDGHMKKVYGQITPETRRKYTDFLLEHRLNPDDISRTTLPDLDELSYANTRGLNAFNILNVVPEPKPGTTWVCFAELKDYTPEFKKRFFERLDAFVPELEKRGLLDKAYIYGFDERGPEYIPIIKDMFGEIRKRYPRIHTLSTCWPPAGTDPLSLNVDWFVPLSRSYDPTLAADVRKRGGEMWWYICCGPGYPYANWMLEFPLIESRVIWWQAFQNDVEGFLYWGLNIWERKNNDKPIPDTAGPRLDWSLTSGWNGEFHGDGVLVFPGEHGPLSTIRLENIRDGLDDVELLRLYRKKSGPQKAQEVVSRVSRNRTTFTRKPDDLANARLAMLRAL